MTHNVTAEANEVYRGSTYATNNLDSIAMPSRTMFSGMLSGNADMHKVFGLV